MLLRTDDATDIGIDDEVVERAIDLLQRAHDSTQPIHGGVLALARGKHVLVRAFGVTPPGASSGISKTLRPAGVPISADDRFLVASLTKPLTCIAVVQLAERGLLGPAGLDARVCSLLPAVAAAAEADRERDPEQWRWRSEMTVRQLLCHTSGLPDGLVRQPFAICAVAFPTASSLRAIAQRSDWRGGLSRRRCDRAA
eukprot:SAG11_NODE_426_length_9563_cov_7.501479_6_plen_198_part_00